MMTDQDGLPQETAAAITKLRLFTEGSQDGFWHWSDVVDDVLEWSDKYFLLLGYSPQAFTPTHEMFRSFLHPDDYGATLHAVLNSVEIKEAFDIEFRLKHKNGQYLWFRSRGTPYYSPDGVFKEMAGSITDIQHIKELEQDLLQANQNYNLAIEGVGVGIWTWTIASNDVYWSPTFYDLLGFKDQEMTASLEEMKDRVHPDDRDRLASALNGHLQDNTPYTVEFRIKCKNGSYRWFKISGTAARDDSGAPVAMAGSLENIHDEKIGELELQDSNERFELATAGASVGIFDWYDIDNDKVFLSDRYMDSLGLKAEDVSGSFADIAVYVHPEDKEPLFAHLEAVLAGKTDYNFEYRLKHKTKGYLWFRGMGKVKMDPQGKPLRMVGSIQDIHKSKTLEATLNESNLRYDLAVKGLSIGLWDWNIVSDYLYCSPRLKEIIGVPLDKELVYEDFEQRMHPQDKDRVMVMLQNHLDKMGIFDIEYRLRHSQGNYIWVRAMGQALWQDNNEPIRIVGSVEDITQKKLAEIELKYTKEAAEAAARAKTNFLSTMSHELRTPLNSIIGFLELLTESNLEGEAKVYTETAHYSSKVLLDLINDILDFSRLESGHMTAQDAVFDLTDLILNVTNTLKPISENKGLTLDFIHDRNQSIFIDLDEKFLRQVLLNICGNAIKFTYEGSVTVSLDITEKQAAITIADTGIGICEENQKDLFDRFTRFGDQTSQGSGLGLAIAQRMIELMQGEILVESTVGQGSTFTIILPRHKIKHYKPQAESGPAIQSQAYDLSDKTILIVDDNEANRHILKAMLGKWNCTVIECQSGQESIDIMSGDQAATISSILMDINMPVMDGIEAMQHIRKLDDIDSNLPIISLTANNDVADIQGYLSAGFTSYIGKPINREKLYQAIAD